MPEYFADGSCKIVYSEDNDCEVSEIVVNLTMVE